MNLGCKVEFSKKYKRIETKKAGNEPWARVWIIEDIKQTAGLFVGIRVLKNIDFYIEFERDSGEPCDIRYSTSKYIKCALIAINKNKMAYVPLIACNASINTLL